MQICELLVTTDDGQLVAGLLVLDGNNVFGVPADGYERLVTNVMASPVATRDGSLSLKDGAEKWFKALPQQYSGSYLRALIVG